MQRKAAMEYQFRLGGAEGLTKTKTKGQMHFQKEDVDSGQENR